MEYILQLENIVKTFPGVRALSGMRPFAEKRRDTCNCRRKWRRKVDADKNHFGSESARLWTDYLRW